MLDMYAGAVLSIRDIYSGHLVNRLTVDDEDERVVINGLNAKSEGGTPSVNVKFENKSPFVVKVFWVDFFWKGNRIRYART